MVNFIKDIQIKIEKNNYCFVAVIDFDENSLEHICINLKNIHLYFKFLGFWKKDTGKFYLTAERDIALLTNKTTQQYDFEKEIYIQYSIPIIRRHAKDLKDYKIGGLKALLWIVGYWFTKTPPPLKLYFGDKASKMHKYNALTNAVKVKEEYPGVFSQIKKDKPGYLWSRLYCRVINRQYGTSLNRQQISQLIKLSNER